MAMQTKQPISKTKQIVTIVVALLFGAVFALFGIEYSKDKESTEVALNSCLNSAGDEYNNRWSAADTDSDGKLSYSDGATDITINYYDAQITCYRQHKVSDRDDYISDLQTKRQQEVDSNNAWLNSFKSTPSSTNKSTLCTSTPNYAGGFYTNCF